MAKKKKVEKEEIVEVNEEVLVEEQKVEEPVISTPKTAVFTSVKSNFIQPNQNATPIDSITSSIYEVPGLSDVNKLLQTVYNLGYVDGSNKIPSRIIRIDGKGNLVF